MKSYLLYVHIVPNGKLYIGITCQKVKNRWGVNGGGYYSIYKTNQSPFYNAIQKYGWDNIQHIVLMENLSKEVACECEKYLIAKYRTNDRKYGYNLTFGGEGLNGYRHTQETKNLLHDYYVGQKMSEEQKQKISKALKGRPNMWQKGVPMPNDIKKKLSDSLMGHEVTEETREKIRKANTGKHPSDETRKKMSKNNCMHNPEVVERMKATLKKTQKERTAKRMATMKERYPDGIKVSDETRLKLSKALKGKIKSEETKQKMRKPKSPEARENMRKAQQRLALERKQLREMELTRLQ